MGGWVGCVFKLVVRAWEQRRYLALGLLLVVPNPLMLAAPAGKRNRLVDATSRGTNERATPTEGAAGNGRDGLPVGRARDATLRWRAASLPLYPRFRCPVRVTPVPATPAAASPRGPLDAQRRWALAAHPCGACPEPDAATSRRRRRGVSAFSRKDAPHPDVVPLCWRGRVGSPSRAAGPSSAATAEVRPPHRRSLWRMSVLLISHSHQAPGAELW